jgi:hypothetical protein
MTISQVFENYMYGLMSKSYFLGSFLFLLFPVLSAKDVYNKADSIIAKVLANKDFYGKYIEEYDATVYIKGNSSVKKKNILYRYAPVFLYLDTKEDHTFVESIAHVHFDSPNHFTHQILAINGSKINADDIRERIMQFLNVNVYNTALFNNHILFPGIKEVFKYYRFEYISQTDTLDRRIHQIRVIPKASAPQLISGFFYITDDLWTIFRFDLEGKLNFSKFRVETEFGLPEKDFLLPLKTHISFHLNLLGNEVTSHYFSFFRYDYIQKRNTDVESKTIDYDLSHYFNRTTDSLPVTKYEKFWIENRPVALTSYEESLMKVKTSDPQPKKFDNLLQNSWFFSQGIGTPKRLNYNNRYMSYSGLLNPLKLAYSKLDGIVYWQEFRYGKTNQAEQELQFKPNVGVLFQRKQIYFTIPVRWLFQPHKMGELEFIFRNRNQAYNSTIIDMIEKEIPDTIRFGDFNLEYYRHYSLGLEGKYEIANGLLFRAGANYDWYVPIKGKSRANIRSDIDLKEDVTDLVADQYRVFLPSLALTWTPRQFYRINGKKKEYVASHFPTFSVECSWGIKGIGKSNSNYTQLEADMQQKIPIGLMSAFQYYIGAGKFLKTQSLYFADFDLFQKNNFPKSWDDPIGGVFHLLSGEWYNASRSYAQAHLMYEFPCTVSRLFFRNISKDILKERISFSQLYMPLLPSYTEIGYGIGNFIGNIDFFVSFNKGKQESFGIRFAFELGK